MVFLLWAHSGNGNRLESTYYHRGAALLWAQYDGGPGLDGKLEKDGKHVHGRRENLKKATQNHFHLAAATFLFNSKLRNHL